MTRIDKVKEKMAADGLDGFVITDMKNIYYLTGFSGSAGTIFLTKTENFLLTDARYSAMARTSVQLLVGLDFEIIESRTPISEIAKHKQTRIGFEDTLDFATYQQLAQQVDGQLIPSSNFLQEIRQIKEITEVELIRRACQITDQTFTAVLDFIEPGREEIEVANFLDFKMRELGASGLSFDTIIASGKRSSLPHGLASHKRIEYGDPVTLDFGCFYEHYASDMTRTIFVGKADPKVAEIYQITKAANESLINQVRAGLSYADYDKIPRDIITAAGYGDRFTHGIGHGFGLDIHEIPYFNQKMTNQFLQKNQVITDEPGIYLPNFAGVRIEDDLLVLEDGVELLNHSPKELIVI